jgi:hypothetical protein
MVLATAVADLLWVSNSAFTGVNIQRHGWNNLPSMKPLLDVGFAAVRRRKELARMKPGKGRLFPVGLADAQFPPNSGKPRMSGGYCGYCG